MNLVTEESGVSKKKPGGKGKKSGLVSRPDREYEDDSEDEPRSKQKIKLHATTTKS